MMCKVYTKLIITMLLYEHILSVLNCFQFVADKWRTKFNKFKSDQSNRGNNAAFVYLRCESYI